MSWQRKENTLYWLEIPLIYWYFIFLSFKFFPLFYNSFKFYINLLNLFFFFQQSFDKVFPSSFHELGFGDLVSLYSELCAAGNRPPIIDSAELQEDPEVCYCYVMLFYVSFLWCYGLLFYDYMFTVLLCL